MSARAARSLPGTAYQYREIDSPLHRLGPGWKIAGAVAAGAAAIAADGPLGLGLLLLALVAGYRLAGLAPSELWRDARWLVVQGLAVVALSVARYGAAGLSSGGMAALQIALFFLPGALMLRTTPSLRLLESIRHVLPERHSFALAASLRFVPYFARELHEIVGAQRLRGARLTPRDLWRPTAWRDWVECVGLPLAVRTLHTANEAAVAARIRGIGVRDLDGSGAGSRGIGRREIGSEVGAREGSR